MTTAPIKNTEEPRLQEYVSLIQSLLLCPSGEEQRVLETNQDLIDLNFLQVLDQVISSVEHETEVEEVVQQAGKFLKEISNALKQSWSQAISARIPQYHQLIESLLACPEGDEEKLLQVNLDLIDMGLLEVMGQRAGTLMVYGQTDAANFLFGWVQKIGQKMGVYTQPNLEEIIPQVKKQDGLRHQVKQLVSSVGNIFKKVELEVEKNEVNEFNNELNADTVNELPLVPKSVPKYEAPYLLMRLLQIVSDTKDIRITAQKFYQLLSAQPVSSSLGASLGSDLKQWADAVIPQIPAEQVLVVSKDIAHFGTLYMRSPIGEVKDNLEIAISAFEIALEYITDDVSPQIWAGLHNNLAICYSDRQLGIKAVNHEQSLIHYQYALRVYCLSDYPQDWAMIQNNMGLVYRDRIEDEKAVNLELAVASFQSALEGYTKENVPRAWAVTQMNLGETYESRIQGDRIENLEKAIHCYRQALTVFNDKQFSEQRRQTEQILAIAETKYYNEKKRSVLVVSPNSVQIGNESLSIVELARSMSKYNLMFEMMANLYIDTLIKDVAYTEEELLQGMQELSQSMPTWTEVKESWLAERGMTEADLSLWVTRTARLKRLKQMMFGHKLETHFLQRKAELDRVRYYLIRHEDTDILQELYFRIQNKEANIEAIASDYGQGDEAKIGGLIGPIEMGLLPPALAQLLRASDVGQMIGPLNLGQQSGIFQIKQIISAQLDDAMNDRLLDELFTVWLKAQLQDQNLAVSHPKV